MKSMEKRSGIEMLFEGQILGNLLTFPSASMYVRRFTKVFQHLSQKAFMNIYCVYAYMYYVYRMYECGLY